VYNRRYTLVTFVQVGSEQFSRYGFRERLKMRSSISFLHNRKFRIKKHQESTINNKKLKKWKNIVRYFKGGRVPDAVVIELSS
tara:strand:- start:676 stop:924 length:249 start_codon:yes stop_codon:yes gene_type:complete